MLIVANKIATNKKISSLYIELKSQVKNAIANEIAADADDRQMFNAVSPLFELFIICNSYPVKGYIVIAPGFLGIKSGLYPVPPET